MPTYSWPHWKLRRYIEYKANWRGIRVIEVSEAYTSQRCSRCGAIGVRSGKNIADCLSVPDVD